MSTEDYNIMKNYVINSAPTHHNDIAFKDDYQNEVYEYCKKLLDENNFSKVIDFGCGSGYKLIKYFNDKETVGIETEPCLSFLKDTYPDKKWMNSGEPEKSFGNFTDSCDLLICADVIEHILDPDELMRHIKNFNFKYLIISTPDRAVLRHLPGFKNSWQGPPSNTGHVREWAFDEFNNFLHNYFESVTGFHCQKLNPECMFFVCRG
jgi:2-polyprenyl-3-methyl-5-hydroxy-6-metoxy-1,4-benzoquinol methylase